MTRWLSVCCCVAALLGPVSAGCLSSGSRQGAGRGPSPAEGMGPRIIVWPPDWQRMYEADRSKADEYLARMRACGGNSAMVSYGAPDRVIRWAATKIRSAGMLVGQTFNFNYGLHYAQHGLTHDPTRHTSYVYNAKSVGLSYCPNCRLPVYRRTLEALSRVVALSEPDFVLVDIELFLPWESVVHYDRVRKTDMVSTIRKCRWCGSEENYRRGLREVASDIKRAVRSVTPRAAVYLWGQWDWRDVPRAEWPHAGESGLVPDGFSGPTPHFYHTTRSTVYRAGGFSAPLDYMRQQLRLVSVENGYPFLTLWYDYHKESPEYTYLAPQLFAGMCRLLADHGAAGFSVWPGPKGISSPQYDAAKEDPPRWALIRAGAGAFGFLPGSQGALDGTSDPGGGQPRASRKQAAAFSGRPGDTAGRF